jgi:HNH endonuclease
MDAETKAFVRARARNRCEYCLLRQEHAELHHHVEHIIAKQHARDDSIDNLALSSARCNAFNGGFAVSDLVFGLFRAASRRFGRSSVHLSFCHLHPEATA